MSHITGSIVNTGLPVGIGPAFGMNSLLFTPESAPAALVPPGGIKFVILHFTGASFPGNNRLEVNLGYETDVFRASDGSDFWTRPINVSVLPGGQVPINYIVDGGAGGGVQLAEYGRGERHEGEGLPGHEYSYSNSDPFLISGNYTEPDYDEYWYCHNPPNMPPDWENVDCLANGDLRKNVARATCMLVGAHGGHISTCSGTLIGSDTVITAAHCVESMDDIKSFSVIFNYQTNCDGSKPGNYNDNAKFHKVIRSLNHGTIGVPSSTDYIILQIKVPPAGLGIASIPMRTSLPAPGEQVFGIHHPNGAVKKVSKKHSLGYAVVKPYTDAYIHIDTIDVSGGSSGSGLFDTMGRFLGVLSNGYACNLGYAASKNILDHIATGPLPSPVRDVFIVFDRSGSMSMDAGTDGDNKITEAKDAANLFVDLVKAGVGHRIGLVSFSTTPSLDKSLTSINNPGDRHQVKGPPGGIDGLAAGGNTTIGGGLQTAAMNFPSPGANKRTILLLTDGLQNTAPLISDVTGSLGNTDISAIGFGTESSLNGALLTNLAQTHNGIYMRAGDGLNLRKFFALSFGDIFENGALLDPEFQMPAGQDTAPAVPFMVCEETNLTIVLGWDRFANPLNFWVETPSGKRIDSVAHDIEFSQGRKWRFVKLQLPHQGEQNGNWKVHVYRVQQGGEFPPPSVNVRYFVNIIARGGPYIRLFAKRKKYYTGDSFNPSVGVFKEDGFPPLNRTMRVTVQKPDESIGNLLSRQGLQEIDEKDGDAVPARFRALQLIESQNQRPVVRYNEETFELFDDGSHDDGGMEPDGVFGNVLKDLLRHEGNYTFRAVASFGEGCTATREITWTVHVDTGIDPQKTTVQTTVIKDLGNGKQQVKIVFTPADTYGNKVGPGRLDAFIVTGSVGNSVSGTVHDLGNGDYEVFVIFDPSSGTKPGIIISQEDKAPVLVVPSGGANCRKWKRWFWIFLILFLLALIALIICFFS